VIRARGDNEAARVTSALQELGGRDLQSLLLEGGPHLAGAFLDAGEVDEARVFVAPLLAGGSRSKPALEGQGVELIGDAPRALEQTVETIDGDVLIQARFREW
jgi:diaminohydroxyphosphoribosylaminopyrimidine deaminase/5-amino-6-(5-phosphoribosylamino)uracil reductase